MNNPKPNRLIHCHGADWSPFQCIGKWVPYKSPPNKPGTGRFMQLTASGFEPAEETWKNVQRWEYIKDEDAKDLAKLWKLQWPALVLLFCIPACATPRTNFLPVTLADFKTCERSCKDLPVARVSRTERGGPDCECEVSE